MITKSLIQLVEDTQEQINETANQVNALLDKEQNKSRKELLLKVYDAVVEANSALEQIYA